MGFPRSESMGSGGQRRASVAQAHRGILDLVAPRVLSYPCSPILATVIAELTLVSYRSRKADKAAETGSLERGWSSIPLDSIGSLSRAIHSLPTHVLLKHFLVFLLLAGRGRNQRM